MITLTSNKSSLAEPFRKNRWIIQFSFPTAFTFSNGDADVDDLAFCAHTTTLPTLSFNPTENHRLNEKFRHAGKPSWNDLSMSFYDYIATDAERTTTTGQVGQILYNWAKQVYNPATGEMGYKADYAANAALAQLDPAGAIVRTWNLFYIWPMNVDFGGALSYEDDGLIETTCNFAYDYAMLG